MLQTVHFFPCARTKGWSLLHLRYRVGRFDDAYLSPVEVFGSTYTTQIQPLNSILRPQPPVSCWVLCGGIHARPFCGPIQWPSPTRPVNTANLWFTTVWAIERWRRCICTPNVRRHQYFNSNSTHYDSLWTVSVTVAVVIKIPGATTTALIKFHREALRL